MFNSPSVAPTSPASSSPNFTNLLQPNIPNLESVRIKIVEQPAMKGLRFRYICEGRSAGSIPGVHSAPENKTFPTIQIEGYEGKVKVVVSCVTKDEPYRPHPHNLVGKEGCEHGVCMATISGPPMRAVFSNLGIQCVKKKDIKVALEERERKRIDPFKTNFAHKDQPSTIDLNVVRLCFQAFIPIHGVKKPIPIPPVVSDPIFDKKSINDLVICRLCSCAAKVTGGDNIILLCEKVPRDDIKVRFFELRNNDLYWEDFGEFQQTDVHKQAAISFKTPRYINPDINHKVQVYIQLYRPSDGETSEALQFEFYPDPDNIKRKRIKTGGNPMNLLREMQQLEQNQIQCNVSNCAETTIGKPQALIVSPTREMAIQIWNEARKYAMGSYLNKRIVYGGTSSKHQGENIGRGGSHILICTPGRLLDFVEKGFISFEDTRFVVLDDADRMLDMGFKESMATIMNHPTMRAMEKRQNLMFSATFPAEIQRMAGEYLNEYIL